MCTVGNWIIGFLLFVGGVMDLKSKRIPLLLLITMNVCAIFLRLWCLDVNLLSMGVGAFIGLLFLSISKITKEAIGYGDSWLILILGIYLGAARVLQLLLVASMLSGVLALIFLCCFRWKKHTTIPFVPFVVLAYVGVMLL